MRRVLYACFVVLWVLLLPVSVQAQSVEIDSLQIEIWPEYDRPEVLVIYRFEIAETTPLPASLTFRIPVVSGGLFNLAYKDDDGKLYLMEYASVEGEDWMVIGFTTPSRQVQLEYYDPSMLRSEHRRNFTFNYPADYTVHSLSVQVQQPRNAKQMLIDPGLGEGQVLQDGLTYYSGLFGEVGAGVRFALDIQYDKEDETLSKGYDPVFPAEGITTTSTQTTFKSVLPWVLLGVGVTLILVVGLWYLAPPRIREMGNRKRHPSRRVNGATQEKSVFCHNCGAQSQPGDKFCRVCGVKLRTE